MNAMTDKIDNAIGSRLRYGSPKVKVIEVKVQNMLCYSPVGEIYITEMEEGNENW